MVLRFDKYAWAMYVAAAIKTYQVFFIVEQRDTQHLLDLEHAA